MNQRSLAWVVAAILLAAGCSAEPQIDSPSAFWLAKALAACEYQTKCGLQGASQEDLCKRDVMAAPTRYPSPYSYDEAKEQGRIAFHKDQAEACIAKFRNTGCTVDEYRALRAFCDLAIEGLQLDGMECRSDAECREQICDRKTLVSGCVGRCVGALATGASCAKSASFCADINFCAPLTKTCLPRAAAGSKCCPPASELTSPCTQAARCQLDLSCKGYVAVSTTTKEVLGTCLPRGAIGDACKLYTDRSTDCQLGLFCDPTSTPFRCRARLAKDQVCTSDFACQDGLACVGLRWNAKPELFQGQGRCLPFRDSGDNCEGSESGTRSDCPLYMRCFAYKDNLRPTCLAVGDLAAPCFVSVARDYASCQPGLYCDNESGEPKGICRAQIPLHGACTPPTKAGLNEPCYYGTCESGTCQILCK